MCGEAHHLAGQQIQRPSRTPAGRAGARPRPGRLHPARRVCAARRGRGSSLSAGQAFLDEARLGPVHGRRADPHGPRDQVVGGLGIRSEENLRPFNRAHRSLAAAQERLQLLSFFSRQRDAIAYVHGYLGLHFRSGVQPAAPPLHRETGPVPGLHPYVHVAAPRAPGRSGLPTVLSGDAASGPRHDRRARAARLDQSGPATTPDDQAATLGRRTARVATDQNHCGEVLVVKFLRKTGAAASRCPALSPFAVLRSQRLQVQALPAAPDLSIVCGQGRQRSITVGDAGARSIRTSVSRTCWISATDSTCCCRRRRNRRLLHRGRSRDRTTFPRRSSNG